MNNLSPDMAIHLGCEANNFRRIILKGYRHRELYASHVSSTKDIQQGTIGKKNNQRDKPTSSKPKQIQAMETTVIAQKSQTGGTIIRLPNKGVHQLLGGQLSVSVKIRSTPSSSKKWRISSWAMGVKTH
jgi:hypothetical protein